MSRIWSEQVDAAAKVEAEAKFNGSGGARALGRHEEDDETNRHGGKVKGTPGPIYKANG